MALPPLVDPSDLATWVGEDISADPRAGAVLQAASTLVRAYCGQDFTGPEGVPDPVESVALDIAGRAWVRPGDVQSSYTTAGPYSEQTSYATDTGAGSFYLTAADKLMLAEYVKRSTPGLMTVATTRGEGWRDTQYIADQGSEPFPFLPDGA